MKKRGTTNGARPKAVHTVSPYKGDVDDIKSRTGAAFIALLIAKGEQFTATFSDEPYDLHAVAVAFRTIADSLDEADKKAKAATKLTMKRG